MTDLFLKAVNDIYYTFRKGFKRYIK